MAWVTKDLDNPLPVTVVDVAHASSLMGGILVPAAHPGQLCRLLVVSGDPTPATAFSIVLGAEGCLWQLHPCGRFLLGVETAATPQLLCPLCPHEDHMAIISAHCLHPLEWWSEAHLHPKEPQHSAAINLRVR